MDSKINMKAFRYCGFVQFSACLHVDNFRSREDIFHSCFGHCQLSYIFSVHDPSWELVLPSNLPWNRKSQPITSEILATESWRYNYSIRCGRMLLS